MDLDDRSGEYWCVFLPEQAGKTSIEVKGELWGPSGASGAGPGARRTPREGQLLLQGHGLRLLPCSVTPVGLPNIKAVKKSEHATERESVVLGCKSDSFPPVSDWVWYKMESSGDQVRPTPAGGRAGLRPGPGPYKVRPPPGHQQQLPEQILRGVLGD